MNPVTSFDRINVLFLDDEPANLTTFKASFRTHYQIFLANNAEEALEILKKQTIHIVFADQRMPGITGVQFFVSILNDFPKPIRVLLTGYADVDAVIDAINQGQVYRYIKKPWNELQVKMTIEKGYELYRIKEELDQKIQLLEKTNHELNRFVYSASHELRAPLMSILGLIKLAKLDKIEPKAISIFDMVEKSVKKLDLFIKNITEYYRNNRVDNFYEKIDLKDTVEDAFSNCDFYHGNEKVDIQSVIDSQEDFYSDAFRVKVIFNNIISNGIKYQKPEEPSKFFHVSATVNPQYAVFTFKDNGIGIRSERVGEIFKMFYRATEANTGSGVGLYLVKEAVDQLGGQIMVESEFGKGTQFTIKIPNMRIVPAN